MTALGHERRFYDFRIRSAYPLEAAQERTLNHFAFGPQPDIRSFIRLPRAARLISADEAATGLVSASPAWPVRLMRA
jgi:hypothetical protein